MYILQQYGSRDTVVPCPYRDPAADQWRVLIRSPFRRNRPIGSMTGIDSIALWEKSRVLMRSPGVDESLRDC